MGFSASLKQILYLLADGEFHSGTELSNRLNISRSAICKQLQSLSSLGVELTAISGKGYKLIRPLQLLSIKQIEHHLTAQTDQLLNGVEIYDQISSTNSYLLQKAQQTHETGIACFAEYQSAGKGRRGRDWISPFGSNIYLSILWRYQNGPATIAGLSLALGVAVVRALNELGVEDVGLKWPNDILWQAKKLAGILIEVSGESGGPCHAVIGLGLNCFIPPKEAGTINQAWVDLNTILGEKSYCLRNRLAAVLLNHMVSVIAEFDKTNLSHYLSEWRDYDCMQGKVVDIYRGRQQSHGVVEGINDQGMLLIKDDDNTVKTFTSGEVSFRKQ